MKTFLVKNPPLLSIYQFCGYITGRALGFCIKISPYIVRGPKFAAVQESSPFVFPYASRNI